ncbi:unnamed protein product [Paramecium sonneborni]|uniref:Uncharacterized protein n=1 Tax=Paramecium sonneborni TaxID=65129 RepID=A0A8S1RR78_9CILI|nr:unnamed protein product [Paramecium sonneborni]
MKNQLQQMKMRFHQKCKKQVLNQKKYLQPFDQKFVNRQNFEQIQFQEAELDQQLIENQAWYNLIQEQHISSEREFTKLTFAAIERGLKVIRKEEKRMESEAKFLKSQTKHLENFLKNKSNIINNYLFSSLDYKLFPDNHNQIQIMNQLQFLEIIELLWVKNEHSEYTVEIFNKINQTIAITANYPTRNGMIIFNKCMKKITELNQVKKFFCLNDKCKTQQFLQLFNYQRIQIKSKQIKCKISQCLMQKINHWLPSFLVFFFLKNSPHFFMTNLFLNYKNIKINCQYLIEVY